MVRGLLSGHCLELPKHRLPATLILHPAAVGVGEAAGRHAPWFPALCHYNSPFWLQPEITRLSSPIKGVCKEVQNIEADAPRQ